jgi:hypothetical protein
MTNLMHNFLKFVYYNPLHVHVSSNILLMFRRSNCVNRASGIVTLKTSELSKITIIQLAALHYNAASYIIVILDNSLVFRVMIPDAVLTQFDLLNMSKILLEKCTCRGFNKYI